MNARFVFFMAYKYFSSWRKQSVIIVAAITGAVFLYVLTYSMLGGLVEATLSKTIGLAVPHVEVEVGMNDYEELKLALKNIGDVIAFSPRLASQALISYDGKTKGVRVVEVYENLEPEVTEIDQYIVEGSWKLKDSCIVSKRLANELGVDLGDKVAIVLPSGEVVKVEVAEVFDTGVFELDAYVVYVSLDFLKEKLKGETEYLVALKLKNPSKSEEVAGEIGRLGFEARHWKELAKNVLDLIEVEEFYSTALIASVLVITGLGIVNVMLMLTESRKRSIGVLKAVGATSKEIFAVYFSVSLIYGILGFALGLSLALLIANAIKETSVEIFGGVLRVPFIFTPDLAFSGLAFALVVSTLSCAYSAYKASTLDPAEVMRFE